MDANFFPCDELLGCSQNLHIQHTALLTIVIIIHYIPSTYLPYNWNFVPFDPFSANSPPILPPLVKHKSMSQHSICHSLTYFTWCNAFKGPSMLSQMAGFLFYRWVIIHYTIYRHTPQLHPSIHQWTLRLFPCLAAIVNIAAMNLSFPSDKTADSWTVSGLRGADPLWSKKIHV